jgi:hypothetical protein
MQLKIFLGLGLNKSQLFVQQHNNAMVFTLLNIATFLNVTITMSSVISN